MDFLKTIVNTLADEPGLVGSWRIKCSNCKQVDLVDGITKQHRCSKCSKQMKYDNGFDILCVNPECPQVDHVTNFTNQHVCSSCGSSKGDIQPVKKSSATPPKVPSVPPPQVELVQEPAIHHASISSVGDGLQIPYNQLQMGVEIGEGTYGVIFKAEFNGRTCAVKRFRFKSGLVKKEDVVKETEALKHLHHECIVRLIGVATDPSSGETMLVMEYLEDGSLDDLLTRNEVQLSKQDVIQIALDVARGLQYLHSQNIIHRDLKSANVLLYNNKKNAKLSDFGTVRIFINSTKASSVVGTLGFMAPEVLGEEAYNSKADVYSFGALLYHMVTKKTLPPMVNNTTVRAKIQSDVNDSAMQHLILQCCQLKPQDRITIDACIALLDILKTLP